MAQNLHKYKCFSVLRLSKTIRRYRCKRIVTTKQPWKPHMQTACNFHRSSSWCKTLLCCWFSCCFTAFQISARTERSPQQQFKIETSKSCTTATCGISLLHKSLQTHCISTLPNQANIEMCLIHVLGTHFCSTDKSGNQFSFSRSCIKHNYHVRKSMKINNLL